jgi:hypothetical protein
MSTRSATLAQSEVVMSDLGLVKVHLHVVAPAETTKFIQYAHDFRLDLEQSFSADPLLVWSAAPRPQAGIAVRAAAPFAVGAFELLMFILEPVLFGAFELADEGFLALFELLATGGFVFADRELAALLYEGVFV